MEITPYQVRWPAASDTQSAGVSALDMAVLKEAMCEAHLDCMVGDGHGIAEQADPFP